MSTTIRAACSGDEEILADLNRFVQELHVARRPDHFRPARAPEVADWFKAVLGNRAARIWIAEHDGAPAGYVLALHHEHPENPFRRARRWCEIDQLAVDPAGRRRGIARALVQIAVDDARACGIHDIEVSSWSFNTEAHQTFRRLGFAPRVVRFELDPAR